MEEKDVQQLLYIAGLIYRQRSGELDEAEQETVDNWLAASEQNRQLFRELSSQDLEAITRNEADPANLQASVERVYLATGIKPGPARIYISKWRTWRWAAAVLVLTVAGAAGLQLAKEKSKPIAAIHTTDVAPGSRKATLKLGNGATIILDDAQNGVIANQGKTVIKKSGNGQLVYDASASVTTEITYNTITTPNGGEYEVILPDGSHVWLNAASVIRFPAAFTGNTRKVEINGEAYLEIVKNEKAPFIVVSGKHSVEVLGTKFNIHSYPKEEDITTTLIQGSIRIAAGKYTKVLQPGQQSLVNTSSNSNIRLATGVNMDEVLAWRNGKFIFDDASLKTVVSQLERWYDVNIDYAGMEDYRFNGEISRNVSLSKVLKMMELTSNIHYKINDRNIYMTK
ncbi:FecR domain-containing protein [Chitinophaga sp. ARDCPP14]|uniref:FecR domain-containing protein n=1 Tax=Chitinophaga sp. ARDCPP14 TaxID=3391139 RepID=UPI003F52193C